MRSSFCSLLLLVALAAPALALAQSPADPSAAPPAAAAPSQAPPAPAAVAPAAAPAAPDDSPPWQPAAASALGVLALAIRRFKLLRWLPDRIEDAATVGVLGCLGSAIPMLEGGGFVWPTSLFTAIAAGVTAAVALWMPASKDPPGPAAGTVLRGGAAAGLALALLLSGCGTTGYNVARGTFGTIREAEKAYRAWAELELPALALRARGECNGDAACVDRVTGKTFSAVEKANASLLLYHQAERGSANCLAANGALETCIAEALKLAQVVSGQLAELGFSIKKGG